MHVFILAGFINLRCLIKIILLMNQYIEKYWKLSELKDDLCLFTEIFNQQPYLTIKMSSH